MLTILQQAVCINYIGINLFKLKKAVEGFYINSLIVATLMSTEYGKIKRLNLGTDEYLSERFGNVERVDCVKSILRRCKPTKQIKTLRKS